MTVEKIGVKMRKMRGSLVSISLKMCMCGGIRRDNEWMASTERVAIHCDGDGFWAAQSMGCGRRKTVDEGGRDMFF